MAVSFIVLVLYLRFVQAQDIPSECQSCGCCGTGTNKCHNDGYCYFGCRDGYWGTNCYNKCHYFNCKKCAQSDGSSCHECKTGYYDKECGSSCAPNCVGCRRRDGQCNACVNGYWGTYCNNTCGYQCKTCNRWNGCTECYNGYHGSNCKMYCGDHCASCDKQNRCTACEAGYYSNNGRCIQCYYKHIGCICTEYRNCIGCTNGYFPNTEQCSRCPNHCTSCTSSTQCTSCMDGRFGNICQYQCAGTCIHGSCFSTNAICQCNLYYTGVKCDQCISEYYGNDCMQACSIGCSSDTCSQYDGTCTCKVRWKGAKCDTCADRYFGEKCDVQCKRNCDSCTGLYNCEVCNLGYYGNYCQHSCGKGCAENQCEKRTGNCFCINEYFKSTNTLYCNECVTGRYGQACEQNCLNGCYSCVNETYCSSCHDGHFGISCQMPCPGGCQGNNCKKNDGSCFFCKPGYFGDYCNNSCPDSCQSCDQYGKCSTCKPGFSNTHKQCTCRKDICINSVHCDSCTNTSYYANETECCLCNIDKCVSCTKAFDSINCQMCEGGYFPNKNGLCETCKSQCAENKCDSSSGRCFQGCINGYWNQTCDKVCDEECLSCSQTDGSCTQCKNNAKYGPNCKIDCSNTCKKIICDITGNCTNGCITNKFGKQCENTCDEYCSPQDNGTLCSEQTGICLYGCQTGYKGRFCHTVIETEADKQTSSRAALGGGIGGGAVALAAILVVGLILFRRRKVNLRNQRKTPETEPENIFSLYATVNRGSSSQEDYANEDTDNLHPVTIIENTNYQRSQQQSSVNENMPTLTEDNLEIDDEDFCAREFTNMFEENGGVYYNNAREISKFKLTVADLPEYVQNISVKDLEEEFQRVPYGLVKPYEVSQTKLNMHRNRYKGIYPYDDTRVVVRGGETDYINASYIDGFRKRNAYIAALGPMAKQLGDFGQFWRMVWQQEVEKIAMVTNLVEDEKTKCDQYWPDRGQSKRYGDINVVCKVEKLYADFIWRQFTVSKNSEERNLHHLLFTSWPDKDIPDDVTSIIEFRQRLNALPSTFDGPAIVHCSAGVGRTGTYIALDILAKEGEAEGAIDIPGCVLNMRQNRPSMIQTMSQYQYLHQALVHSLTLDCSLIKREHFNAYMKKSSKQEIQKHFEKLQLTHEQKSDTELAATDRNRLLIRKNRKHADIPGDSNRPRLHKFLKPGESDYINAININSFRTKNRFLVAQTPLLDTVIDFIALAVQENCSCIVSMEAPLEKQMGVGLYFPGDNQVMKKGMFSVRSATCQSGRHFVKRMLHFEYKGKTKIDETIPHYEYLDWDEKQNVPKTAEHFVAFIKEVEYVSKSSDLKGPILVHCLNGAGKSGLFSVVWTLLEKLSEDNDVSVVNAVQKVRARRVLSVPNKEQFYFCYECVLHSVNETVNAVYYNINGDIQRE